MMSYRFANAPFLSQSVFVNTAKPHGYTDFSWDDLPSGGSLLTFKKVTRKQLSKTQIPIVLHLPAREAAYFCSKAALSGLLQEYASQAVPAVAILIPPGVGKKPKKTNQYIYQALSPDRFSELQLGTQVFDREQTLLGYCTTLVGSFGQQTWFIKDRRNTAQGFIRLDRDCVYFSDPVLQQSSVERKKTVFIKKKINKKINKQKKQALLREALAALDRSEGYQNITILANCWGARLLPTEAEWVEWENDSSIQQEKLLSALPKDKIHVVIDRSFASIEALTSVRTLGYWVQRELKQIKTCWRRVAATVGVGLAAMIVSPLLFLYECIRYASVAILNNISRYQKNKVSCKVEACCKRVPTFVFNAGKNDGVIPEHAQLTSQQIQSPRHEGHLSIHALQSSRKSAEDLHNVTMDKLDIVDLEPNANTKYKFSHFFSSSDSDKTAASSQSKSKKARNTWNLENPLKNFPLTTSCTRCYSIQKVD